MIIGILAESNATIFTWRSTERVLLASGCEIAYFVEEPTNRQKRQWAAVPARVVWRLISKIENMLIGAPQHVYSPINPSVLPCRFSGHFKVFPKGAIDELKSHQLDLLIRLGGRGIYRGEILSVAKDGLISIHHGDPRRYRGGPPGFWEIINDEEEVGYVVQRLTETLDGGDVLAIETLKRSRLAARNRDQLYKSADTALADMISRYITHGKLPKTSSLGSLGPIYRMPGLLTLITYLRKSWASWSG